MKHILVFALCAFVLVPMAFAAPMSTVTVDSSGGGNFLALQPAMDSFCTGGANAAAAPPFTINIVPQPTPYDEILSLNDDVFVAANGASQELAGALTIQSSVPGTDAWVAIQNFPGFSDGNDGWGIYQSNNDVTVIDLLLTPSVALPASAPADDLVKVDENQENQPSAMNTTTFSGCVFSDLASPSMTPLVTDAAGWMTLVGGDHPSTVTGSPTAWGASGSGCLKMWGDSIASPESASYVVENCIMYSAGHCLQMVPENDGETALLGNLMAASYLAWNSPVYIGCGDGATGGTTMAGTDVLDPANCIALFTRGWHNINVYKSDTKTFTIEHLRAYGDSDTASHNRGISLAGAGPGANFADLIIASDMYCTMDRIDHAQTFDRVTMYAIEAGDDCINVYLAGTGSLTATDCIFAGPGDLTGGTGSAAGGVNIDYSVVCQNGPDALGTSAGATLGVNCTYVDPAFLNRTDITSVNFFAVDNAQLATMASGGGPLRGGGLYVGGGIPVELSIFSTN